MPRRSWDDEDNAGEDLDQPVTITGRQLRSLKMGSTLGLIGFILALIATGAAAWTMLRPTPKSPEPAVAATPTPAPAATDTTAAAAAATPAPTPAATAPVTASSAPPEATKPHTTKAATASATKKTHAARTASHAEAPKMESFDPGAASPAPAASTPSIPTPVPIPVEHKAAPDTTHH